MDSTGKPYFHHEYELRLRMHLSHTHTPTDTVRVLQFYIASIIVRTRTIAYVTDMSVMNSFFQMQHTDSAGYHIPPASCVN